MCTQTNEASLLRFWPGRKPTSICSSRLFNSSPMITIGHFRDKLTPAATLSSVLSDMHAKSVV